ncbi:heat shock 70 kDa protein cognate 1-like protein, partial [Leptotrombidium deliense]
MSTVIGKLEVFENDHGQRTTPSYVAFSEFDCIIGNEAKIHTIVDPVNTVYDAKRLIGRKFTEKV